MNVETSEFSQNLEVSTSLPSQRQWSVKLLCGIFQSDEEQLNETGPVNYRRAKRVL